MHRHVHCSLFSVCVYSHLRSTPNNIVICILFDITQNKIDERHNDNNSGGGGDDDGNGSGREKKHTKTQAHKNKHTARIMETECFLFNIHVTKSIRKMKFSLRMTERLWYSIIQIDNKHAYKHTLTLTHTPSCTPSSNRYKWVIQIRKMSRSYHVYKLNPFHSIEITHHVIHRFI